MSSHTFDFQNEVPGTEVEQINPRYDGLSIAVTIEVHRPGKYIVAGGQVGAKSASGHDTFNGHRFVSTEVNAKKGHRQRVHLPVSITSGYWAVGVFRATNQIETSLSAKSPPLSVTPLLIVLGLFLLLCVAPFIGPNWLPKSDFTPETERQKQEGSVRAILQKYGPAEQSDEQINQGAKNVVDEWERATGK